MRYDMFIVISFFTYFRSWKWLVLSLKLYWWGMSSDMCNRLCLSHSSLLYLFLARLCLVCQTFVWRPILYLFSQTMSGMSDLCLAPHVLQGVLFWSNICFFTWIFLVKMSHSVSLMSRLCLLVRLLSDASYFTVAWNKFGGFCWFQN